LTRNHHCYRDSFGNGTSCTHSSHHSKGVNADIDQAFHVSSWLKFTPYISSHLWQTLHHFAYHCISFFHFFRDYPLSGGSVLSVSMFNVFIDPGAILGWGTLVRANG
jgi:hypothetical protein